MALSKKDRQLVWLKSNGICWYCGCKLPEKGWHADHVEPIIRDFVMVKTPGPFTHKAVQTGESQRPHLDNVDNTVPSCAPCNLFKSTFNVEGFRHEISQQVKRARNTSVNFRTAERFDLIKEKTADVVFWFETQQWGDV